MARYLVAAQATADLDDIWTYLDTEAGEAVADAQMNRFHEEFRTLAELPFMGRARSEIASDVRTFPAGNYTIFYQPINDGVEIVRVRHASRDPDNILGP